MDAWNQWASAEQYETFLGLAGLAESFRARGCAEEAYKCLTAILSLQTPYLVTAKTYCEIGKLLLGECEDVDHARPWLEKTMEMCRSATPGTPFEELKLEAASCLAEVYLIQDDTRTARDLLHNATQQSQHLAYWQCHFIFQLAKVFLHGNDYTVASQILQLGEDFSVRHQAVYLNVLFELAGLHIRIRSGQTQHAVSALEQLLLRLDSRTAYIQPLLREQLRFYALSLEILARLQMGQAKSVRNHIVALQQSTETISSLRATAANTPLHYLESFSLTSPDMIPALLNAVSMQFFGMVGYHEKLDRTFHRSIAYLDNLLTASSGGTEALLVDGMRICMYQQIIPTSLTTGRFVQALQGVKNFINLISCKPQTAKKMRSQAHFLVAICNQQLGYFDLAESQLTLAARHCTSPNTQILINLNLALCYLKLCRYSEFSSVAMLLNPQTVMTDNGSLRCACALLHGLVAFIEGRGIDSKAFLRNVMPMANNEDLNQLMAHSLILMSKVCTALGEYTDCLKVAKTGFELAEKIPDQASQISALHSLRAGYGIIGDHANLSNVTATLNRFLQKESQEMMTLRQSSDFSLLRYTGE